MERWRAENKNFVFAPEFAKHLHQPVISIGVGFCTFSNHLGCLGAKAPAAGGKEVWGTIFGIYCQNNPVLDVSAEILPKNLRNLFIIVRLHLNVAF